MNVRTLLKNRGVGTLSTLAFQQSYPAETPPVPVEAVKSTRSVASNHLSGIKSLSRVRSQEYRNITSGTGTPV